MAEDGAVGKGLSVNATVMSSIATRVNCHKLFIYISPLYATKRSVGFRHKRGTKLFNTRFSLSTQLYEENKTITFPYNRAHYFKFHLLTLLKYC